MIIVKPILLIITIRLADRSGAHIAYAYMYVSTYARAYTYVYVCKCIIHAQIKLLIPRPGAHAIDARQIARACVPGAMV